MRKLPLSALAILAIVAIGPGEASAQRPSTLRMSCDEAADLVDERGAIVLSTGRHTYDRFVASAGYCRLGEFAYRGVAPTADDDSCRLGYVCKNQTPLFEDGFDIPGRR